MSNFKEIRAFPRSAAQSSVESKDKRQAKKISILNITAERTSNIAYLLLIRLPYLHNTEQCGTVKTPRSVHFFAPTLSSEQRMGLTESNSAAQLG
jgi:hypothetical protein